LLTASVPQGKPELSRRNSAVFDAVVQRTAALGPRQTTMQLQPGPAARALQLLGKHVGLFTERPEVGARSDEPLSDLTEDAMFELLSMRRAPRAKRVGWPGSRTTPSDPPIYPPAVRVDRQHRP
jgi:hypothetical protein